MNGQVTFEDPPNLIPKWLVDFFGNSYFGNIDGATLCPTKQDGTRLQQQISEAKQESYAQKNSKVRSLPS